MNDERIDSIHFDARDKLEYSYGPNNLRAFTID